MEKHEPPQKPHTGKSLYLQAESMTVKYTDEGLNLWEQEPAWSAEAVSERERAACDWLFNWLIDTAAWRWGLDALTNRDI